MFEFDPKRIEGIFYDRKENVVFKIDNQACFLDEFLSSVRAYIDTIPATDKQRQEWYDDVQNDVYSACTVDVNFVFTLGDKEYRVIFLTDDIK